MGEHARSDAREREAAKSAASTSAPVRGASPRTTGPSPAQALQLQRSSGNRAASRVLSRWAAHPDKDKKGVLMPDEMAAEFNKFNPPLSK